MNSFYDKLEKKQLKIAVVGLGYVGLPLLISLSKKFDVIGFDKNEDKISSLKNNKDLNNEIDESELSNSCFEITDEERNLQKANFFIVAVPTPIDKHKNPDLAYLNEATITVGRNIPKNSIIVYESTVYPGATEEFCIPILEKESGLKNKKDFSVGYSPERINPGDKVHTLDNIVKIVSAQDQNTLDIISRVYGKIIKAGIYKAENIRVAEAAKVIENTQRDINVALINELSIIFHNLSLDTSEVLAAARTKWNFLEFYPGLVGGHCIGVDPYYLTYKAKEIGYHPEVITTGRKINDNMGNFIGEQILKNLLKNNYSRNKKFKVILFGITFKENVKDFRNTKVMNIFDFLKQYNIDVQIYDPVVNKKEIKEQHNIKIIDYDEINEADAAVFCVAHNCFKEIDLNDLRKKMNLPNPLLFDIKWIFNRDIAEKAGFKYWRL